MNLQKIAFFIPKLTYGGAERVLIEIANNLEKESKYL